MQKQVFKIVTKEQGGTVTREYPMKEAMSIATRLGMDMEIDAQYMWFLKQAMITLLPKGWKRESDPKGRIKYHNTQTNATTATHPLLFQYRIAFFRLLQYLPRRRSAHHDDRSADDDHQATVEQELLFQTLVVEQRPINPQRDKALVDADEFYASVIGQYETRPPHFIEEMAEYQQANPLEMLEMAHKLGIGNDYRYFWIARMALVVPLPPCFELTFDAIGHTKYLNTEHNVLLEVHPAVNYLQKMVSRLRTNHAATNSEMMFFYDKQLMPYVVDLTTLVSGSDLYRIHSDTATSRGLLKSRRALYHEERGMKEVIEDMMLLELTRSAKIDLMLDLHLVGTVHQFIQRLVKDELLDKWNFRYTIEGEHYWYHTPEERAYRRFPYTKTLKSFVKKKKKKIEKRLKNYIRIPAERHPLFRKYGDELCDSSCEEARLMMTSLLKHVLETNRFEMPKEDIDVEETFKIVSEKMTKDDVLDMLFSNPFVLDDGHIIAKEKEKSLDVSTDSEIFTEAGFKLEGDKIVLVVKEKEKVDRKQIKGAGKARIMPRRKGDKSQTVKLGPDAMLPFQVQVSRILAKMQTMRQEQTAHVAHSSSSSSSEESSLTEEEEDKVASLNVRRTRLLGLGPEVPASEESHSNAQQLMAEPVLREKTMTPPPGISSVALAAPRRLRRNLTSKVAKHDLDLEPSEDSFARKSSEYTLDGPTQETNESTRTLEIVGMAKDSKRAGKSEDLAVPKPAGMHTTRIKSMQEQADFMEPHEEFFLSPVEPKQLTVKWQKQQAIPSKPTSRGDVGIEEGFPDGIIVEGEGMQDRFKNLQKETPRMVRTITSPNVQSAEGETEPEVIDLPSAQEQATIRQLMGKVSEDVAESYLDALGMSLNSERSVPRSSHGTAEKKSLPADLRNEIIIGGLKKILEPEIAKRRDYFSAQPMTMPKTTVPRSRFPQLTDRSALKTRAQVARREPPVATGFEHTETFRTTETAAVKAGQRQLKKQTRPYTQAASFNGDGLPENFVLIPNVKSPTNARPIAGLRNSVDKSEVQIMNFLHYLGQVGFPMSVQSDQRSYQPSGDILPQHVIKMGKRLGLMVSSVKFSSAESDLLWIPLLQLSCPLPRHSALQSQIQNLILLPLGTHPGDEFFMLMTSFNRRIRALELARMKKEERVPSMVKESWLCLSSMKGQRYFYNFLTGNKTQFLEMRPKDDPDLGKDERVQVLKRYLEGKLSKQVQSAQQRKREIVTPKASLNLASLLK